VPKGEAHVALAASEKPGGVGVAIDGAAADLVIQPNFARVVPVNELLLDGGALGVMADGAVAGMAVTRRGRMCFGFRRAGASCTAGALGGLSSGQVRAMPRRAWELRLGRRHAPVTENAANPIVNLAKLFHPHFAVVHCRFWFDSSALPGRVRLDDDISRLLDWLG
jgi:hypothetical protein